MRVFVVLLFINFFWGKKKTSGRGGGIGWEMINLSPGGEGFGRIGCDPVRRPKKSASLVCKTKPMKKKADEQDL